MDSTLRSAVGEKIHAVKIGAEVCVAEDVVYGIVKPYLHHVACSSLIHLVSSSVDLTFRNTNKKKREEDKRTLNELF